MKAYPLHTKQLTTNRRCEMVDMTAEIERCVKQLGIAEGMVVVHVPHTTAAVTINENADPDVQHDLIQKLSTLIPQKESFYQHGEGNSDSHLKSTLTGCSQTILIERGALALGTWQGVYFCEFDGPRTREVWIKLVQFS